MYQEFRLNFGKTIKMIFDAEVVAAEADKSRLKDCSESLEVTKLTILK